MYLIIEKYLYTINSYVNLNKLLVIDNDIVNTNIICRNNYIHAHHHKAEAMVKQLLDRDISREMKMYKNYIYLNCYS